MIGKILRWIWTILGGLFGYGLFVLGRYLLIRFGYDIQTTPAQQYFTAGILVVLFAIISFKLVPLITRQSRKVAANIGNDLQGVSASDIIAVVMGLIAGLIVAFLITQIYAMITNRYIYTAVTIVTYLIMGYLGVVVASSKGREIVAQVINLRIGENGQENGQQSTQQNRFSISRGSKSKKNQTGTPKILDTSVIIDGRIAEIMKTGFLEGPIVIPEFVLVELRHIADSSDALKRTKGRRGLDILNKIQTDYGIEIYNTDNEKTLKDIPEVDVKLLKLAQLMNGKVVTNDFNLNKVATINGVDVLNINELANTLKPVVIPGEKMTVTPVKQGKDSNQSIAYLDDGTMVVVEDGRKAIGETTEITVTSVLQTAAGRMIFGRIKVDKR